MASADTSRLFAYNRWANLRMLDGLEDLTGEELTRDLGSSFRSVLATLVHLVGSEWVWLQRWLGASPTGFPDLSELTSVEAIRARWDDLWQEQRAFLDGLDEGTETRTVAYRNTSGTAFENPLGELMRHVVNHSTYHRGQLATMLRQLGREPPSTDYIRYLREGV